MNDIKFTWTPKGLAFAKLWSTPKDVIAQVLREFGEYEIDPENLMFHTTFIGPMSEDRAFLVTPVDHGTVLIDIAVYEDACIEPESGPFKGKAVFMPRGSEDE